MTEVKTQQIGFSTILFDTLFGLVLFFSIDSVLAMDTFMHFAFYVFSIVILVHWWLIFKSADDAFDKEVTDSGVDLVFGIVELMTLEYIVLMSREFDFTATVWFVILLLLIDLIWTILWRFVGKWRTAKAAKVRSMEKELDNNLTITSIMLILLSLLVICSSFMPVNFLVLMFFTLYAFFIALTFRYKIINLRIF